MDPFHPKQSVEESSAGYQGQTVRVVDLSYTTPTINHAIPPLPPFEQSIVDNVKASLSFAPNDMAVCLLGVNESEARQRNASGSLKRSLSNENVHSGSECPISCKLPISGEVKSDAVKWGMTYHQLLQRLQASYPNEEICGEVVTVTTDKMTADLSTACTDRLLSTHQMVTQGAYVVLHRQQPA